MGAKDAMEDAPLVKLVLEAVKVALRVQDAKAHVDLVVSQLADLVAHRLALGVADAVTGVMAAVRDATTGVLPVAVPNAVVVAITHVKTLVFQLARRRAIQIAHQPV